MAHRLRNNFISVSPGTVAVVVWLSGCGGADLKEYRPARDHSAEVVATVAPGLLESGKASAGSVDAIHANQLPSSAETQANEFEVLPVSALVPVNIVDGANVRALMSIPASDPTPSKSTSTVESPATNSPDVSVSTERPKIEVLVKEKTFRTESKTGAKRVSFDDLDLLKVLNMDPVVENAVELMPDWLRNLNGKTIRIRGFMYPTYDTEGIEHFVLARDNQICCFGRDPKIYDLVQVNMKEGKSTHYIPASRAFDVIGKFKIEMHSQEGKPYGLYAIDQADVIDR